FWRFSSPPPHPPSPSLMPCHTDELRQIPLFSLLDSDELTVLSQQVELRDFAANQRIYKAGDPSGPAYVMLSGAVEVTLIDEDGQELIFSQPAPGTFLGCPPVP